MALGSNRNYKLLAALGSLRGPDAACSGHTVARAARRAAVDMMWKEAGVADQAGQEPWGALRVLGQRAGACTDLSRMY